MLHILFGVINRKTAPDQYVHDIDAVFDYFFEEKWMQNDIAKRAVKEIDKSELVAPKVIESPVLRTISHEWLSGGTKQIILAYNVPEVVYDGDNWGDNCWPLLLEISKVRDIAISLSYYPYFEWVPGVSVHIINTDEMIDNFRAFNSRHIKIPDDKREFSDVNWHIRIDTDKFVPEEIDF